MTTENTPRPPGRRGLAGIDVARLIASPNPVAEIAAAATLAQEQAGLPQASYLIVAVTPGELDDAGAQVREALGIEALTPVASSTEPTGE